MLHLIWTKDNSGTTSEEDNELKGIRQRLIECYRSLYFDPVDDSDSRQQTNRIAKNMIEYVIIEIRRREISSGFILQVSLRMQHWPS
jgi:hypothetical protein